MRLVDVEKAMYEDEEFLKYLPLFKEEYWKKASPTKKLKFFQELQRIIHKVDPLFPEEVEIKDMGDDAEQNVMVTKEKIFIRDILLKKRYNPYDVFTNYIFELELVNNIALTDNEEFMKTEKGKMIEVNCQSSILGEWNNFYSRRNPDYFYQPIVWESTNATNVMAYNLLKYMHNSYGMDAYIGDKISGLMLKSFKDEKDRKKVLEVYKRMEENASKGADEAAKLEEFFEYMNSVDLDEVSDDEFYSLFNTKLMNVYNDETLAYLFGTYVRRELQGFEHLEEVLEELRIGETEDYGKFIYYGDKYIFVEDYKQAFFNLIIYVSNIKLRENINQPIKDEKLLKEAKDCYLYLLELQDEQGSVDIPYLANGLSYYEYRNSMIEYYYNKIKSGIKNSPYYNTGKPYLDKGDLSKYEAFLEFAFGKTFEEVKEEQLAILKNRYEKKIGGKR